jgi:hypothetical protein
MDSSRVAKRGAGRSLARKCGTFGYLESQSGLETMATQKLRKLSEVPDGKGMKGGKRTALEGLHALPAGEGAIGTPLQLQQHGG